MHPIISVIMPVYNQRPSYLSIAIESILNQTLADFEFLIVDDCSTEKDCVDLLKKYQIQDSRIRIIRNTQNCGVAKSLNNGIAHSSAPIIARMDSDDIALPMRLEKQYFFLKENESVDLLGCWAHIIDEHGHITGIHKSPVTENEIRSSALVTNPIMHPTWMFRKSLVDTEGGYSESSPSTEDYEFILRIANRKNIRNLPEILFHYRFNPNGVSYSKNKYQELESLKLRFKAIQKTWFPFWYAYKIIPSLLFFLFIPFSLKSKILRFKQRYL